MKAEYIPQAKLLKILQMIIILRTEFATIKTLAERFDTSERTIYRYLNLIEAAGFILTKDHRGKFSIHSGPL